jgi:nucleotide-binding universal stress UspA family protein
LSLLETARDHGADLVVVGTHGGSRAKGIAFDSVATVMVHDAPS